MSSLSFNQKRSGRSLYNDTLQGGRRTPGRGSAGHPRRHKTHDRRWKSPYRVWTLPRPRGVDGVRGTPTSRQLRYHLYPNHRPWDLGQGRRTPVALPAPLLASPRPPSPRREGRDESPLTPRPTTLRWVSRPKRYRPSGESRTPVEGFPVFARVDDKGSRPSKALPSRQPRRDLVSSTQVPSLPPLQSLPPPQSLSPLQSQPPLQSLPSIQW